jgi:hypothetical protein
MQPSHVIPSAVVLALDRAARRLREEFPLATGDLELTLKPRGEGEPVILNWSVRGADGEVGMGATIEISPEVAALFTPLGG